MKKISLKHILIAALFVTSNVPAQSLKELIHNALEKNYRITILKNEAEIAANNNDLGNAGFLPKVDLNGSYSNTFNNTRQEFADNTVREGSNAKNTNLNFSVIANWTLFNGFRIYAKGEQLEYLEKLGELNSKFYIEQTVSDIVTAYHQLIYEHEVLKNYRQSLAISRFRSQLESKRKAVGGGKAMNYGQALVDYQSDSIRVLAQESRIASLKIDLNAVLNNQLEADIRLIDSGFRQFNPVSKEEILKSVEAANSQLEQQRLMELIAETEIRMALGDAFPKIDIYAGYQYSKSTATVGFSNSNQSYGPTFGITISFNLYNGGETNRAIKNSELYSSNSKLTKEEVEQDIHSNVLILYTDFNSISQQINLAKSNVEEMTKVYQTAEEQLKRGAINGYDFRLTQQMLLNSELTLKQLQFSLKMIEINLNRLSGHILDLYL